MERVGIRDLKVSGSQILRRVREFGAVYEVTYHGRVVARIVPVHDVAEDLSDANFWTEWDRLSAEISADWPPDVSAVDAVREQRREL